MGFLLRTKVAFMQTVPEASVKLRVLLIHPPIFCSPDDKWDVISIKGTKMLISLAGTSEMVKSYVSNIKQIFRESE